MILVFYIGGTPPRGEDRCEHRHLTEVVPNWLVAFHGTRSESSGIFSYHPVPAGGKTIRALVRHACTQPINPTSRSVTDGSCIEIFILLFRAWAQSSYLFNLCSCKDWIFYLQALTMDPDWFSPFDHNCSRR